MEPRKEQEPPMCRWHDCPLDGNGRCDALANASPSRVPRIGDAVIDVPKQTPEERFRLLSLGFIS